MTFRPRNAYYLRISTNIILPLFLYLDERHIHWMSDTVLQHVLADLRPLIIPKLQVEKDVHFGPGTAPGNKRGSVEVHRGETYQFAYFFRKTEPHTVLLKSRYFVTAPLRSEAVPKPASPRCADRGPQDDGSGIRAFSERSKRKRAKSGGKGRHPKGRVDEDERFTGESEEDIDVIGPMLKEPRPARKQRRVVTGACHGEDEDGALDMHQDVTMDSPLPFMDGEFGENPSGSTVQDDVVCDAADQPSEVADIELVVDEEETKPKPLLKLKYQSFLITGHCLCVVVEPWPPLRAEPGPSVGLEIPLRHEGPILLPDVPIITGRRSKTPLFLPEYDRAPSEAPFAREKTLPPVPPFHDAMLSAKGDDEHSDDDLMTFSQTLNAVGHIHAIAAEDDDDMDGAVLFGDADEVRELF